MTATGYFMGMEIPVADDGIQVLFYHGLVEKRVDPVLERNLSLISDFRSDVSYLKKTHRLLTLSELSDALTGGKVRRGAVITFDDGHENNLIAGEICDENKIPWSLFVSTGGIGDEKVLWPTELTLLMLFGEAERVEISQQIWPLENRHDRERVFRATLPVLKSQSAVEKNVALTEIRNQFPTGETSRLLARFPSQRMLCWSHVRQLADSGVEIGSHGVDHEIHHSCQPRAIRDKELDESKTVLEHELGRPCRFFAFPNGDFNSESINDLTASRYELGFTTQAGTVHNGAHPHLLPRLVPTTGSHPLGEAALRIDPFSANR